MIFYFRFPRFINGSFVQDTPVTWTKLFIQPQPIMIPVAAILQARMTSTRLPGKALCPLAGVPLIEHIINRLKAVADLDHIILAIPDSPSEIPLIETARRLDISVVKGPEEDVLQRFLMAAEQVNAQHVVRICGDNPLFDRQLTRSLIHTHLEQKADYTITCDSIPLGTGTEVARVDALKNIARTTTESKYREHVTTWFHDHPAEGIQPRVPAPGYLKNESYRLTVDTENDLAIYGRDIQKPLHPCHPPARP